MSNYLGKENFSTITKVRKPFSYLFTSFIEVEHYLHSIGNISRYIRQNIILVTLIIETLDFNIKKSYQDNFSSSNKIDKLFEKLKIQEKSIKSISYEMKKKERSIYNSVKSAWDTIFEGYQTTNEIEIKLADLLLASDLIDGALAVKNVLIKSVRFEVDPELKEKNQSEINLLATEDSFKKANITSDTLGLNINGVNGIIVENFSPSIWEANRKIREEARVFDEVASDAPALFSGKTKIDSKVSVTYLVSKKN